MLLNLIIATVILVAVFVGMIQVQRRIKGERTGFAVKLPNKRQRDAGPNELEAFIDTYRRDKNAAAPQAPFIGAPVQPAASAPVAPGAVAATRRPQFLAGPHKLAFLVLKTALPDHHVFANARLGDVLELEPAAPLAARPVDFVVCSKNMAVVAAVLVEHGGTTALTRDTEEHLRGAGLRCVRLQPPDVPRPAEMRRLVVGE